MAIPFHQTSSIRPLIWRFTPQHLAIPAHHLSSSALSFIYLQRITSMFRYVHQRGSRGRSKHNDRMMGFKTRNSHTLKQAQSISVCSCWRRWKRHSWKSRIGEPASCTASSSCGSCESSARWTLSCCAWRRGGLACAAKLPALGRLRAELCFE